MAKSTKFNRWVKAYGITRLANDLGIKRATIFYWQIGQSSPKSATANKILKLAKGALKLSDLPGVV